MNAVVGYYPICIIYSRMSLLFLSSDWVIRSIVHVRLRRACLIILSSLRGNYWASTLLALFDENAFYAITWLPHRRSIVNSVRQFEIQKCEKNHEHKYTCYILRQIEWAKKGVSIVMWYYNNQYSNIL